MTLFWCEIHDASAPHEKAHCWYAVAKMNDRSGWGAGGCRVIERRLVALDGIDVEELRVALERYREMTTETDIFGMLQGGHFAQLADVARQVLAAIDQEATPR